MRAASDAIVLTPAQKKGLIIGKKYIYRVDGDKVDGEFNVTVFRQGSIVEFIKDDGSASPRFAGEAWDGDTWAFAYLGHIYEVEATNTENTGIKEQNFSITVNENGTMISTKHVLTHVQVSKILEIIQG